MSAVVAKDIVTIVDQGNSRDVIVYELSPADLRENLMRDNRPGADAGVSEFARYAINSELFPECSLSDLAAYTRLPLEEIESLLPSQLRKILAKAKELNPDFFNAQARRAEQVAKNS